MKKKKLLLQICCAPCGTYISKERLAPRYQLTWYYCNPNILSLEEWNKRLEAVKLAAKKFSFSLIIEPYNHLPWVKLTKSRAADPEGGRRCQLCYRDRLEQTAALAKKKNFDFFGTTLGVSPWKNVEYIRTLGQELTQKYKLNFLDEDFQANDAYRKSQALAKDLKFYRQKFCGCEYSVCLENNRLVAKKILKGKLAKTIKY